MFPRVTDSVVNCKNSKHHLKTITQSRVSMSPWRPLLVRRKTWTLNQSGIYTYFFCTISFNKSDTFIHHVIHNDREGVIIIILIIHQPKANIHTDQRQFPFGVYVSLWGWHDPWCFPCSLLNKDYFRPLWSILHNDNYQNLCCHVM